MNVEFAISEIAPDGGGNWTVGNTSGGTRDVGWDAIGEGTLLTGPAAAISPNGLVIHVFGVGTDHRVWRALSMDGGGAWPLAWSPIDGETVF